SQLSFNDVEDIIRYGLHEYLDDLEVKLNHMGDEIFNSFFSLSVK
ncbi:MAG: alpha-E domain-containing protein, partial [Candidatus Omnitrophica bacterium]|nr:alpha-E domain-containing protein [Candidatus Omnitrophota bacterium]